MKKSSFQLQQEQNQPEQQKYPPTKSLQSKILSPSSKKQSSKLFTLPQSLQQQNLLDMDSLPSQPQQHQYQKFLQNRVVIIEGPQLVTQNVIKSYKLYKIKTRNCNLDIFDSCVYRRFSDFEFLQKQLIENYGGYIIPLLPEKNIWANLNMQGRQQISNRITNLQKYLKYLLEHKKIRKSRQLKYFLFESESKFSQMKGEYFSKMRTQEKIKSFASNAYNLGKDVLYKFINGSEIKNQENFNIAEPNSNDLKLIEFQKEVIDLIKVINVMRKVVQTSVLEMKTVGLLMPESGQASFKYGNIMNEFEDLCKYIFSCNEALQRRNTVRLEIDQLNAEYVNLQKKIKTNPRSQQVDILRNKLAKATQKCQKWTSSLLEQLQPSISVGRSMIECFITYYSQKKHKFYNL